MGTRRVPHVPLMTSIGDDVTLEMLERDPVLARMRAEQPVCWVPALEMWLVTRWDDVAFVEAHPELFTAATEPSFLARALGPNMLTADPPDHTRLQQMMLPPFQPGGRSGDFVTEELTAIADRLLDDITGPFDVMADYAQPLSAGSLATVLGLDAYGFDAMWRWCEGLCTDLANFENDPALAAIGGRTMAELGEALKGRIASAGSGTNAIDWFVRAGASTAEIVNNVRLMISGGINEPRDGIGLVTWVLLSRPDLRAAIEAEPEQVESRGPGLAVRPLRRLIEEVFRVYSPVGTITRQATADIDLGGASIKAGDLVSGVLRSINLDETQWEKPAELRLDRREGMHAAFALGTHRCLGEWLGRQEVRVGVERLFARFPDLSLDANHEVEIHGFEFRGPRHVQVTV